jgi:hypothetical protein
MIENGNINIINIREWGDALRNTGYKNIESAAAEIVDNSIEANAKDIFIIATESIPFNEEKNVVTEIAFLDNGNGMDVETLQKSLQLGSGTKKQRTGMGRFGVGLPQSSLYAAPIVEVYSWQGDINNTYKSYLDINELESGKMTGLPMPEKVNIPDKYSKYIEHTIGDRHYSFSGNGTLVIWRNCDNVKPQRTHLLFENRFEPELGKRFRHFLKDCKIILISPSNSGDIREVLPNDPLFLNKDNLRLGPNDTNKIGKIGKPDDKNWTEPLFEKFIPEGSDSSSVEIEIDYRDKSTKEKKKGLVKAKFSIVKERFYSEEYIKNDPGGTEEGKWVKKLEGISIVRAKREIDFGDFHFYSDVNEPTHRWWGIEIAFNPELDEAFNVANNKQHVELSQLDDSDYEEDDVKPIWIQLNEKIPKAIREMYRENKNRRKGTRTEANLLISAEKIINDLESDDIETQGKVSGAGVSEDEKIKSIEEMMDVSEETARELKEYQLKIVWKQSGEGNRFIDYEFKMGGSYCFINTDHLFYKKYLHELIENDSDARIAFGLFAASYVRAIDEAKNADKDSYNKLHDEWMDKLKRYIKEQDNS